MLSAAPRSQRGCSLATPPPLAALRLSPRRAARAAWQAWARRTWRGAVSLAGASVVRSLLSSVVSHSLRSARQNEPLLPPRAGAASEARRAAPRPIGRHLPERAVEGRLACRRWLQEVPPNGELPTSHQTNKSKVVAIMVNNCTKKTPTPRVWRAPASTQKTKKESQAGHSPERAVEGQQTKTKNAVRSVKVNYVLDPTKERKQQKIPGLPRDQFSGPWLFSTAEARTINSSSSSENSKRKKRKKTANEADHISPRGDWRNPWRRA